MKYKKLVLLIVILVMIALVVLYMKRAVEAPENVNAPLDCTARWVDDVSTLEETIDCIYDYRGKKNDTKAGN